MLIFLPKNGIIKVLAFLFFALLSSSATAQDSIPERLLEDYRFRNIGPAGMSGRITSIQVDQKNKAIIYVGSASGGLWKSKNAGQSWTNIFKNEKVSSVGSIALHPHNPDVIWVGTGEGNPRNSLTSGYGLYKTSDGGKSWKAVGLEGTRNIHRIIVHPHQPNIIYVAAIGTPWGDSPNRGVYKSVDGGENWAKILYVDERTGAAELVMDPNNPDKLIVNMWEHRREPWVFKSGGKSSGLYVSFDGGESWKKRTEKHGLPKGDLGRLGLAIAASNSDKVYALVEHKGDNALYVSNDGGFKWTKVSESDQIGNRPFYYAEIYVDPKNENRIFSLWSTLTRSDDGGKTWKTIAPYSTIHPDHHALYIDPNHSNYVINGNDGGLNISHDGGNTWRFIENLPIAQFYHINYDMQQPYNVYGGMQDNGSWKGPAYVWSHGGIRNSYWQELYFGDGFDVVPDPSDSRFAYAMSQEGYVGRVDMKTGYSKLIRPVHPDGKTLRFNWNAAIAQNPFDKNSIYFGAQYVFKSNNKGDSWKLISPDLTTNDSSKQKASESGGLTFDVTGAENYTTILCIEPSSLDEKVIWVSTDDGRLHLTRDGGESWTDLSKKLKGAPSGCWIPQVVHSTHQKGAAFVVLNDYRRNNWKSYLYYTSDYGKTFKRLVDPAKVWGYCLSVVQDPKEENLLFLGTNNGLYFSWDFGQHWQKWGKDFPTVPVNDLKIHPREGDVIAGTFGQSCLILDDLQPLREMIDHLPTHLQKKGITLFTPPNAYDVHFKRADGTRFAGHAVFQGENRSYGAQISFWNGFSKSDSIKAKKVRVRIKDENGKEIRKFYKDYKEGFNRFYWGLDAKRVKFPNRNQPIYDTTEAGGLKVIPGQYKVILELGEHTDSTLVQVQSDPRIKVSYEIQKANFMAKSELYDKLEGLQKAAKALKESKKSIAIVKKLVKDQEKDSVTIALHDSIKGINKKIQMLEERLYGKKVEGYYAQPEVLKEQYSLLSWYMNSNRDKLTPDNKILISKFLEGSQSYINDINTFYAEDWSEFKNYVDQLKLNIFKPTSPIQMLNK